MQLIDKPSKIVLPFANAGIKRTIPTASQIGISAGAASFTDGFPPLTRTDIALGGIPPSGLDMNGVLFDTTALSRWHSAGGGFQFDAAFAADVGGYPKGAKVLRTDGVGYWLNTVDNNSTDPESSGAGWVSDFAMGEAAVGMSGANVTLTALQAAHPIIRITGTLTNNLQLFFPAIIGEWLVINDATGAFTVTTKTVTGTGVSIATGSSAQIYGDTTNINQIGSSASSQPLVSSQSLTANGYCILSSGLILQWGRSTQGVNSTLINFPVSFPNQVLSITSMFVVDVSFTANSSIDVIVNVLGHSLSGWYPRIKDLGSGNQAHGDIFWQAIGN